jgi:hypothetical protein
MCPGIPVRPSLPVIQPQVLLFPDPVPEHLCPVNHQRGQFKGRKTSFHFNIPHNVMPKPKEESFNLEHARLELRKMENRKLKQTREVPAIWLDPALMSPV